MQLSGHSTDLFHGGLIFRIFYLLFIFYTSDHSFDGIERSINTILWDRPQNRVTHQKGLLAAMQRISGRKLWQSAFDDCTIFLV